MDIDAMTGVERPRNRLLWAVVGFLVPVVIIGGGAAFFIHNYIAPIVPHLPLAALFASNEASTPKPGPAPASRSAQAGTASAQSIFSGLESASPWPSVTLTQSSTPAYASADPAFRPTNGMDTGSTPITGPIPMPPPRPRISSAAQRSNAPQRARRDANEQD